MIKEVYIGDQSIVADDIDEVKSAHKSGVQIERVEKWFSDSNSGKTSYNFSSAVPVKRPRWTARDGYRISRVSEFWLKKVNTEFYETRL